MSSSQNRKLEKHLPKNIKAALAYVDYETFPFEGEAISTSEMIRILRIFVKSGKSYSQIRSDLLKYVNGEETEFNDFITNYKKYNLVISGEEFTMIFMGLIISLSLFIVYYY